MLALSSTPTGVTFGFLAPSELSRISVKEITLSHGLDNLQRPVPGGLYDLALGPFETYQRCQTCSLNSKDCPGHMGHIKLVVPVYHPLLFPLLYKLLRQTCFSCYRLRLSRFAVKKIIVQLLLLNSDQAELVTQYSGMTLLLPEKKKANKSKPKSKMRENSVSAVAFVDEEAQEDDEDEVEEIHTESEEEMLAQHAEAFQTLDAKIAECKAKIEREGYTTLSSQALKVRSDTLQKIWAAGAAKRCPNCNCPAIKLRKDGSLKFWVIPWSSKQNNQIEAAGVAIPDIMRQGPADSAEESNERGKKQEPDSDLEQDMEDETALNAEEAGADLLDDESGSDAELSGAERDKPRRRVPAEAKEMNRGKPKSDEEGGSSSRLLLPNEVLRYIKRLWHAEVELLDLVFGSKPRGPTGPCRGVWQKQDWNIFFLNLLPVSPCRFRPPAKLNGTTFDHPQNFYYKVILKSQEQLKEFAKEHRGYQQKKQDEEKDLDREEEEDIKELQDMSHQKFVETWLKMQNAVNQLMDSSKGTKKEGETPQGIRQSLEKKEGLFRKNMMGKRVNFAARSVISPDPNIRTDEIGIPERFAKVLTYPTPVTAFNVDQLRRAVVNGPFKWPGANAVLDSAGNSINLQLRGRAAREALAKTLLSAESERKVRNSGGLSSVFDKHTRAGRERMVVGPTVKVVYRHLLSGDVLLVNRQPTLHKPSMMAHRVKVLRGQQYQTIRMHYANCKTYNADFDGDEINLHFPQNELARAEAYHIANNANQYVSCKDGGPLRGLIQDSIDSGILLTKRDTFVTAEEFQQLLYGAFGDSLRPEQLLPTPIPCILKPKPLWSGKQVITALLSVLTEGRAPMSMCCKTKLPASVWGKQDALDLELDESVVLIRDGELLSGVLDKNQIGASEKSMVHVCFELYAGKMAEDLLSFITRLLVNFLQGYGHSCGIDDCLLVGKADADRKQQLSNAIQAGIDATIEFAEAKNSTPEVLTPALQAKLRIEGHDKRLDDAIKTAMNSVTSKVIDACLPNGLNKGFPSNCMSLMTLSGAKGSMVNFSQISALLGGQELEGRRVPLMASGKSLPSFARYDPSPRAGGYVTNRFLTGIRPQEYYFHCMAGREGLVDTAVKTATSGYLQRCLVKHLESLKVAYDYSVRDVDGAVVQFLYGDDAVDPSRVPYLYDFSFLDHNQPALEERLQPQTVLPILNRKRALNLRKKLLKEDSSKKSAHGKHKANFDVGGEILAQLSPGSNLGAVSDKFRQQLDEYLMAHSGSKEDKLKFKSLMELNYLSCLCAPGEAVGVLTAQSIGEPSTQMTLNTFHLAGHGGANVTLGIPRLREIIMTASKNMKTPIMELPLRKGLTQADAKKLSTKLDRVVLMDFLVDLAVEEELKLNDADARDARRLYKVTTSFVSLEGSLAVTAELKWTDIQRAVENELVPKLDDEVRQTAKLLGISGGGKRRSNGGTFIEQVSPPVGPVAGSRIRRPKARSSGAELAGEERRELDRAKQGGLYEMDDEDAEGIAEPSGTNPEESDRDQENDDEGEESAGDENGLERKKVEKQQESLRRYQNGEYVKLVEYDPHTRWARVTVEVKLTFPKILMMSMVERVCEVSLVRHTKGIKKSFVVPKTGPGEEVQYVVQTDGVNFEAGWSNFDKIDTANIRSNDIASLLVHYGVEAARRAIVSEVQGVFGVYGIEVDPRHLGLLADYMTFFGDCRPLNRMGIENNSSPFQKISFETSINFVLRACLNGDVDTLSSPSSELVMGKPVTGSGTGSFALLQQLSLT
eukprot:gb/GEZN01000205.1/.p1 GENE.gb/GEZN01000205.1/~~gb/GEZN01000205.1/.p1  ORF type:complete len:1772 (+),score=298.07 gb/GEZN01000205.1/:92-5407(+)